MKMQLVSVTLLIPCLGLHGYYVTEAQELVCAEVVKRAL